MHFAYPNINENLEFIGCGRFKDFSYYKKNEIEEYKLARPKSSELSDIEAVIDFFLNTSSNDNIVYEKKDIDKEYRGSSLGLAYLLARISCLKRIKINLQGDIWCTGSISIKDEKPVLNPVSPKQFEKKIDAFLSEEHNKNDFLFIVPSANITQYRRMELYHNNKIDFLSLNKFLKNLNNYSFNKKTIITVKRNELELLIKTIFQNENSEGVNEEQDNKISEYHKLLNDMNLEYDSNEDDDINTEVSTKVFEQFNNLENKVKYLTKIKNKVDIYSLSIPYLILIYYFYSHRNLSIIESFKLLFINWRYALFIFLASILFMMLLFDLFNIIIKTIVNKYLAKIINLSKIKYNTLNFIIDKLFEKTIYQNSINLIAGYLYKLRLNIIIEIIESKIYDHYFYITDFYKKFNNFINQSKFFISIIIFLIISVSILILYFCLYPYIALLIFLLSIFILIYSSDLLYDIYLADTIYAIKVIQFPKNPLIKLIQLSNWKKGIADLFIKYIKEHPLEISNKNNDEFKKIISKIEQFNFTLIWIKNLILSLICLIFISGMILGYYWIISHNYIFTLKELWGTIFKAKIWIISNYNIFLYYIIICVIIAVILIYFKKEIKSNILNQLLEIETKYNIDIYKDALIHTEEKLFETVTAKMHIKTILGNIIEKKGKEATYGILYPVLQIIEKYTYLLKKVEGFIFLLFIIPLYYIEKYSKPLAYIIFFMILLSGSYGRSLIMMIFNIKFLSLNLKPQSIENLLNIIFQYNNKWESDNLFKKYIIAYLEKHTTKKTDFVSKDDNTFSKITLNNLPKAKELISKYDKYDEDTCMIYFVIIPVIITLSGFVFYLYNYFSFFKLFISVLSFLGIFLIISCISFFIQLIIKEYITKNITSLNLSLEEINSLLDYIYYEKFKNYDTSRDIMWLLYEIRLNQYNIPIKTIRNKLNRLF